LTGRPLSPPSGAAAASAIIGLVAPLCAGRLDYVVTQVVAATAPLYLKPRAQSQIGTAEGGYDIKERFQ